MSLENYQPIHMEGNGKDPLGENRKGLAEFDKDTGMVWPSQQKPGALHQDGGKVSHPSK